MTWRTSDIHPGMYFSNDWGTWLVVGIHGEHEDFKTLTFLVTPGRINKIILSSNIVTQTSVTGEIVFPSVYTRLG